MKFQAQKKDLIPILSQCAAVTENKSPNPILQNTLINAGDTLRFSATNLSLSLSGSVIEAVDVTEGGAAVNARDLLDRVKAMRDGPIGFELTDTLTIRSGSRKFVLPHMPAEEFPAFDAKVDANPVTLASAPLAAAIDRVKHSVSTDETRLHLNSALLELVDGVARMVSTDGHRLTKTEYPIDGADSLKTLIPLRALHEIRKLCDGSETLRLALARGHSRLAATNDNNIELSVTVPDAQFPPWQQVIPKQSKSSLVTDRGPLAEAIKAVSVAASKVTGSVVLSFAPGTISVSSATPESGDGYDSVPCEYSGPEIRIGASSKYLINALSVSDSDTVTIAFDGELDPLVFEPGQATLVVVMPQRI